MRRHIATALAVAALGVSACSTGPDSRLNKTDTGTGTGVLLGGLVGSQFGKGPGQLVGIAVGAIAGGIIGNDIGRKLDDRDRDLAQRAEYDALERGRSGEPERWGDPQRGRYGEVIPQAPYQRGGRDCRNYTHTVYFDGRPEIVRSTACREPDGTWRHLG